MIKNFNEVKLLGNVGRAPVLRNTTNGTCVCDFSIATTKKWTSTKNGEVKTKTDWHKIVVWGKLAETVSKIINKGDLVLIDGELSYRTVVNEATNETKIVAEIEAEKVLKMASSNRGIDIMNDDLKEEI